MNEGAHQLRLYHESPNGLDPLTNTLLKESHVRYVPCATLLVRVVKAPKGPNGRTLEVGVLGCSVREIPLYHGSESL